ncbi:MAG TPA: MGMT family protein [Solirubrobacterales bacterium]|nr:MGMT family protein [Solirubrobacterales bacterium]
MSELGTRDVLARIRAIPPGFVSTYGDVCPAAPRYAGSVLARCDDREVPWQRVVRADGSLAKGDRQRRLLEREGVPFRGARVEMRVAHVPADALDELAGPAPGGQ